MGWRVVRLAWRSGLALAVVLVLAVLPTGMAQASSTWTSEHEFQVGIPDGWNIQLNAAGTYNEPDLRVLAQTPDQTQEINVYHETLGLGDRNALQYLQDNFSAVASNRLGFTLIEAPNDWDVDNATSGAEGSYFFTDSSGTRQEVDRLIAVRGVDVYVLNVLPTVAYGSQHLNELFDVLDSFRLLP
jgi:hypothetical protein